MSDFNYIAEVPVAPHEEFSSVLEKVKTYAKIGFTMFAFPDRARNDNDVATCQDIINLNIYSKLAPGQALPIIATRNKTLEEMANLGQKLKAQGVNQVFVVTGDAHKSSKASHINSLEIIPVWARDFRVGAVAHPDELSLVRDSKKIEAGAKFLIAQATYNYEAWTKWIKLAAGLGFNKKANIIQTIIPISNRTILENIKKLYDVNFPDDAYNKLAGFTNEQLMTDAITSSAQIISEVKQNSFFSGVYIYSKDFEVLKKVFGSVPH